MQFSAGLITIVGLVAVVLAIVTWVKSKGSILKSLGAFVGAAIIMTFIVQPSLMSSTIPNLLAKIVKWFTGLFG